ncbi:MAG TPA: FmdB family zinc ribbon protein [Pseudonocardia sp.]|nr:FmdB family zinc ribbon protein [Pseudonocardia sp.]
MPTYQYACTACGHRFEAVQAFSDATLTECPECAGRLRKVFSSVGIVFKGSGFYRTDSRAGAGVPGGSSSEVKAESKSEPKSESKSESKSSDSSSGNGSSSSSSGSSSSGSSSSGSGSSGSSSTPAAKAS